MTVVRVGEVSKRYPLGVATSSLKRAAAAWLSRRAAEEFVWALRDVSFSVDAGETVGLIGHNGAGKSTALRLLAGISKPDTGIVETHGRMAALIALGAGFHPDLTGRENIFLNGTLLGLTREEIRRRFDEIVAFSELEKFLDTPLRSYSSGMSLRLSFSVAAILSCDILLVDEVLSVGDEHFAEKCLTRMRRMRANGTTIILASHDLWTVSSFCSRAILFREGMIQADGPAEQVVEQYQKELEGPQHGGEPTGQGMLRVVVEQPEAGELRVGIAFDRAQPIDEPTVSIRVRRHDGLLCCSVSNRIEMEYDGTPIEGEASLEVRLRGLRLLPDQYTVEAQLADRGGTVQGQSGRHLFTIHGERTLAEGVFEVDAEWTQPRALDPRGVRSP
jgi:ABC-type polysaccharide/polyol phosphate transport system ATPase subunit